MQTQIERHKADKQIRRSSKTGQILFRVSIIFKFIKNLEAKVFPESNIFFLLLQNKVTRLLNFFSFLSVSFFFFRGLILIYISEFPSKNLNHSILFVSLFSNTTKKHITEPLFFMCCSRVLSFIFFFNNSKNRECFYDFEENIQNSKSNCVE